MWWRAVVRGAAIVLLLLILLGAGWLWLRVLRPAWQGVAQLVATRAVIERLTQYDARSVAGLPLTAAELAQVEAHLSAAHQAWAEVAEGLATLTPVLGVARGLPIVGPALAASPDAVALAAGLSGAGADLSGALSPAAAELELGPLSERVGPAVARLREASPRLRRAEGSLGEAQEALGRLADVPLPESVVAAAQWKDRLTRDLPTLRAFVHQAAHLVGPVADALGVDEPRTYVVLGQSEEERRASGGYLGSIGVAHVAGGRIVATDFRDSRDWSRPDAEPVPPPTPLAEFMGFGSWHVRDANWFADFPTSAAWVEWFLAREWGIRADGVVALDQEAVRALLEVLGPLDLPRYGERITAENLRERVTYWLYAAPAGGEQRAFVPGVKSPFVADLGQALLRRVVALGPGDAPGLLAIAQRLLAEKHVLVVSKQQALEAALRERGWDGRLPRTADDFLYVLEHTVSYTKVAPYVVTTRHYTVTVDGQGTPVEATLALRYENRYDAYAARALYPLYYLGTYWDLEQRREAFSEGYYAALVRVLAPPGSVLVSAEGWSAPLAPGEEAGYAAFGGLVALPAGQTRTVTLTYRPGAAGSSRGTYRLTMPKQPGTLAVPFTVTVRVPAALSVRDSAPPAVVGRGMVSWQGALRTDEQLTLALVAP